MNMQTIETLAKQFSDHRHTLADLLNDIDQQQRAIIHRHLRDLRLMLADTAAKEADLRAAIEASPELFGKPRTRVLHGVKVGITKSKGKVEIPDEEKTIDRIRKLLPEDQAELLINVKEKVDRSVVSDITAADLKRLGIRIAEIDDAVVIRPVDSALDKLISALLADIPDEKTEVAA